MHERELWFLGPKRIELRAGKSLGPLAYDEVKARALHSGVSQGTELLLYRGEGPHAFDPSLDSPGAPIYPRRYGYAWVGEITESRAEDVKPGQRIFALEPHGDVHCLRRGKWWAIPADIPSTRATLLPNMETAVNAVWDAGVSLGDVVVVLGGGVVGLMIALLAQKAGAAEVRLIEPSSLRRQAARNLGVERALPPDLDEPHAEADVVIEATGNPACLDNAILHAGHESTIVVVSFYGERRSPISLGSDFHRRRLQIKSSQVSRLPAHQRARWDSTRRLAEAARHLRDDRLDRVIGAPLSFEYAPAIYARLDADPGAALHTVFSYR